MEEQIAVVLDSLHTTWVELSAFLPRLIASLVVLTLGWLVARGLRRGTVALLRLLRLDTAAERTGLEDFLLRGGVRFTAVTLAGQLVYWVTLLATAMAVFNLMGLRVAPALIDRTATYLPDLVAAVAILVLGSMLARFVRGLVQTWLNNIGVAGAHSLGVLTQVAMLGFVLLLALEQLGIGGQVLVSAFQLGFGGVCLALALAFGLGGREWASDLLQRTGKRS
jgi:hypothetical protein